MVLAHDACIFSGLLCPGLSMTRVCWAPSLVASVGSLVRLRNAEGPRGSEWSHSLSGAGMCRCVVGDRQLPWESSPRW